MMYYNVMQFLHPMETRSYKEAARAIRKMGKACILERLAAIKRGENCQKDLLTCMLELASKSRSIVSRDIFLSRRSNNDESSP